jgi:transcriptional repressor NrdR
MICPFCKNVETRVVDKRDNHGLGLTRRRRECTKCSKRFTTHERVESDLMVIKKDGRRERFDREKIKSGMLKACEKRSVSQDKINESLARIEGKLRSKPKNEIKTKIVGELVMKELKKLDEVAYIRFASVYKEFQDVNDFKSEIKKID